MRRHTDCRWMRLYIERWLKAPASMPDGSLQQRDGGTPQDGVASPLLANLFLHYAFDEWKSSTRWIPICKRSMMDVTCQVGSRVCWRAPKIDQLEREVRVEY